MFGFYSLVRHSCSDPNLNLNQILSKKNWFEVVGICQKHPHFAGEICILLLTTVCGEQKNTSTHTTLTSTGHTVTLHPVWQILSGGRKWGEKREGPEWECLPGAWKTGKKNQENDVEKFIDFKWAAGVKERGSGRHVNVWGHGERGFSKGEREIKCKKKRREADDNIAKNWRSGGENSSGNYVITAPKAPQKYITSLCFCQDGFSSQLSLKTQDCRRKKIMWTYYSYGQKSESRVLMQRGDKKVSNPAQRTIDSISHSGPFLASVMVI